MQWIKRQWRILRQSGSEFFDLRGFNISAALSYYAVFSIPPVIYLIIRMGSIFLQNERVSDYMFRELGDLIGHAHAQSIYTSVQRIDIGASSWLESILSIVVLLFTASTVFSILQDSFNRVFDVEPAITTWGTIKRFLLSRAWSFAIMIGLVFIMLVSLVTNLIITYLQESVSHILGQLDWLFTNALHISLSFIVLTLLFFLLYRVLPVVKLNWKEILPSAMLATVLFMLGKYAIGTYIGQSDINTVYKSAASIIIILIWANYSSAIVLFGCIHMKVRYVLNQKKIEPSEYAIEKST